MMRNSKQAIGNKAVYILLALLLSGLTACGDPTVQVPEGVGDISGEISVVEDMVDDTDNVYSENIESESGDMNSKDGTDGEESKQEENEEEQEDEQMVLSIDGNVVEVKWEDNETVTEIREQLAQGDITVNMSMYGGFEQVGSLGRSFTRNDKQTSTGAGDIVLYSGNQIVVFYGSNSWAYTRLGKIQNLSGEELTDLLGNGNVTLTLSLQ